MENVFSNISGPGPKGLFLSHMLSVCQLLFCCLLDYGSQRCVRKVLSLHDLHGLQSAVYMVFVLGRPVVFSLYKMRFYCHTSKI